MQIKEIKWVEDKDNNIIVGNIEDYDLFEIENIDNIVILTDKILNFGITYPKTVEDAKKNAKELLNKFINKIIYKELPRSVKHTSNNSVKIKPTKKQIKLNTSIKTFEQLTELTKQQLMKNKKNFNTDNWKKQKRDSKGRFISKKAKKE